ncbi:MAG: 23S rRNA (adenine(2503)-C(2))-methyltransferase RlmN [Bacillota bacterium]|nr:23S rRNA (adenine(2503)-C(2))-methyltransferase RlmN [Bacillota bacterium]MDW7682583.1 23S rRNA (adenine(2503)-C(2))-methyltransferase RlmN [Bacillota bacterium]
MKEKAALLQLSPKELKGLLASLGQPAYRAGQILDWVYRKGAVSFAEMTNIPTDLRARLGEICRLGFLEEKTRQVSGDGTEKYLFVLSDGQSVETVILPYEAGYSACISTQAGCKMGCLFCASGLPGFIRNLTAGEIMAQVLQVKHSLQKRGRELKSLVLMGSGEPLDNFTETMSFLEAVEDPDRLGMSLRHVTLSTSGLAPKIRELAAAGRPLTLAVSLHAPNNVLRNKIMPINRKYPLEALLAACDEFAAVTGRRITYEYILIDGVNDKPEHAAELAALLKGRLSHVNLIPLNAVPELGLSPSPQPVVGRFARMLRDRKVNVTVRRRLGADIAAACGQLRNNFTENC